MIIHSLPSEDSGSEDRIVIIGGGTLGLYAARELALRGKEVLVIEAGSEMLDSFDPDSYSVIGKAHDGISIGRSKSLGGTSNLWGGQLVEFQPIDFQGREWMPGSRWPVTYEEITPYYAETYERLGIPAQLTDDAAVLRQAEVPVPDFSNGAELFLTRWLKIPSSAVAYSREIRSDKKIRVLLRHVVTGFEYQGDRIAAVRVRGSEGGDHAIRGGTFILANGTIETVRLLLHAASSPECPWAGNPNIGLYFQDHLVGRVASVEILDKKRFYDVFSTIVRNGHKFQPKLRLSDSALRAERILNLHGMMSFESSVSENLVYLKQFLKAAIFSRRIGGLRDLFTNLRACGKHLLPLMWKYVVSNRIFVPGSSSVSFHVQAEQQPIRESRMTIDPGGLDARGLPRIVLDWRIGKEELPSIRAFTKRIAEALAEAGLARFSIDEELETGGEECLARFRDNYHQVGGACMGFSAADGVVDRELKVFGTSNLHVIGASTFRTSGNANTTFTAFAFTTRLIDHLIRGQ